MVGRPDPPIAAAADPATVATPAELDALLPQLVGRPRLSLAIMPAVLLGIAAMAGAFTATLIGAAWAVAAGITAVVLGRRALQSSLIIDFNGIEDRGVWRTRRFPWSEVHALEAATDSLAADNATVTVVTTSGNRHTVWSGLVCDPFVAIVPVISAALATAPKPVRQRSTARQMTFSLLFAVIGLVAASAALAAVFDAPKVAVDPSDLRPGDQVIVITGDDDGERPDRYLRCDPMWHDQRDAPAGCAELRPGALTGAAVAGAIAAGSLVAIVAVARLNRHSRSPDR
jgi:hypothetical protein